jgi:hypothetical protein
MFRDGDRGAYRRFDKNSLSSYCFGSKCSVGICPPYLRDYNSDSTIDVPSLNTTSINTAVGHNSFVANNILLYP